MFHYRWYKDSFLLSKITLSDTGFTVFWKEIFLAGTKKSLFEKG